MRENVIETETTIIAEDLITYISTQNKTRSKNFEPSIIKF